MTRARWPSALGMVSGALVLTAGILPYDIGPGPIPGSLFLGGALLAIVLGLGLLPVSAGATVFAGRARTPWSQLAVMLWAATVPLSAALLGASVAASLGAVPGVYYPTPGGIHIAIVGCDTPASTTAVMNPGFPPYSHVEGRWFTSGKTEVEAWLGQTSPASQTFIWSQNLTGEAGNLSFTGTGGFFHLGARSVGTCPAPEFIDFNWAYSLAI